VGLRLLNPKIIFIFLMAIMALPQPADATWYCYPYYYDNCPSSYPIECCIPIGGGEYLPVCLYEDYDCDERCCLESDCSEWDSWFFCPEGFEATCLGDEMRCCADEYYYFERMDSCIPDDWKCVGDIDCEDSKKCSSHKCVDVTCPSDYWDCLNEFDKQEHNYEIEDHGCTEIDLQPIECYGDEVCDNGECVRLACPENENYCADNITKAERSYSAYNHECVSEVISSEECGDSQVCEDGECVELDCDDGDNCTLDDVANHQCIHIFLDEDEDGICDANDACPEIFGSGADGCPATTGEIIASYEDYFWLIPYTIAGVVIVSLAIYAFVLRKRKPRMRR
jgi:hypothetical protein